jgi:serine protease Do
MPPLPLDRGRGARVSGVAPSGAAGQAGLRPGDLITSYAGVRVGQPYTVAALVQEADPRKPSEVVVVRAGKEVKLTVTGIAYLPPEERVKF